MRSVSVQVVDADRVDLGDRVSIAKAWDVTATGGPRVACLVRLRVVFDEQLRRGVAASVRVDRVGEGQEVTATSIRDVRVQSLVATSSMRVVEVVREDGRPESLAAYLEALGTRTDRTSDQTVLEAVTLYRIASAVNLAPLKFVSEQLGMSVSTATRLMARAREAGLARDLITRETYNREPRQ